MTSVPDSPPPIPIMERLEKYGYISVGTSFLILGMAVFAYGWLDFLVNFGASLPKAALALMNDLLLVVILLELFRTIVNFLKTRVVSLEPFLHVGIIAAVRKILTVGAEIVLTKEIEATRFTQYLLDVGVHAAVILALVIGLYLYRNPRTPAV